MARDMGKKAISDARFDEKTYDAIGIRLRKGSDVLVALEKCTQENGIPIATYIHESVVLSLTEDGEM